MKNIGVGIIGTGFMGKAHALAYRAVSGIFPVKLRPVLEIVADDNFEAATRARAQHGFKRMTPDWKELIADPAIQIVSITAPNVLHKEMALAAIAAGKHVHCEKPIAPSATDAREMMEAAEKAKVVTQVGYNYIKNPMLALARDMIAAGELGDIIGFRGIHAEDYMLSPEVPFNWRLDPSGGGAVADLGSHIIGIARFLVGPITDITADLDTIVKHRPVALGAVECREILVNDSARLLVRFSGGFGGSIEASWVAAGRKMQLAFEISGTKGSLAFTQERFNELHFYKVAGNPVHHGFIRIEAGPQHKPYGYFCVAPGHQLGFNDLKTIEVASFLDAIAGGAGSGPDFREAWEIQRVVDTAIRSAHERRWHKID